MGEIIDATPNIQTACMTLRIANPAILEDKKKAEVYARSLENCLLSKLVTRYEMDSHPPEQLSTLHPEDDLMLLVRRLFEDGPGAWRYATSTLRLTLNQRLMQRRGLVPIKVLNAILSQHSFVHGVASPEGDVEWVIRVRVRLPAEEGQGLDQVSGKEAARLYTQVMEATVVGGRKQVELADLLQAPCIRECRETQELSQDTELVIETSGSALAAMAWERDLDWERCTSNDVIDVYNTLGVAAAKCIIFHELRKLVAGDSSKVNDRHIMMVADNMCHHGIIMPINRHGINRTADTGPLMRCSFEETPEVLSDAAIYNESDHMRGVSQSIMMGCIPFIGTGCCQVLEDPDDPDSPPPGLSLQEAEDYVLSGKCKLILQRKYTDGSVGHFRVGAGGALHPVDVEEQH